MSMAIAYYSAPAESHARSMADMGVTYAAVVIPKEAPEKPGEWLEYSPLLSICRRRVRPGVPRHRGRVEGRLA